MSRWRVCVALSRDEVAVLFPDGLEPLEDLAELEWPANQALPRDLGARYDACITGWTTVIPAQRCFTGDRLQYLIHCGGSVRRIVDKTTCDQVIVSQPGAAAMAEAVAEMSLALSLVLTRDIHSCDRLLHSGADWITAGHGSLGVGLTDRTIGILGLGRAGRSFAAMCRALGARQLLAFDPYIAQEQACEAGAELVDSERLFTSCDLIVNHLPSTSSTYRFVDATRLSLMRDNSCFVNTARSWSVDMAALAAELESGRLKAAIDVFDTEPLPPESVFRQLQAVLTPHVAGGTTGARRLQGELTVEELGRALRGETLYHVVTPELYDLLA